MQAAIANEKCPAIERFIDHIPRRAHGTDDFSRGMMRFPKDEALDCQYVQVNQIQRKYVIADTDYEGAGYAWKDAGLPQPTIITISERGHAHLLWELKNPVYFPDPTTAKPGRLKPRLYYKAVEEGIRDALKADHGYRGYTTKNPLHPRWRTMTCDVAYELGDLASNIDLPNKTYGDDDSSAAIDFGELGTIPEGQRHDTMFDLTRRAAYRMVRHCHSLEELFDRTHETACRVSGHCSPPLSSREVQSTSRSIAKWCWVRRHQLMAKKNRGAMSLPPICYPMEAERKKEEVRSRQVKGAEYANHVRKDATNQKIKRAIEELQAEGKKLTQAAVAKRAGISDRALRKRGGLQQLQHTQEDKQPREAQLDFKKAELRCSKDDAG